MQNFKATPAEILASSWRNRSLIRAFVSRAILGRYRGSYLGILWSFVNPLIMLAVYTFVFSVVFKMRMGVDGDESRAQFAMVLFVGIIVHALFAEVIIAAPSLILNNVNYVKKVVFPLEILPLVSSGAALFHMLISASVLLVATLFINGFIPLTAILAPVVLVPFIVLLAGFSWLLASIGVYLRDANQVMGIVASVMLFLAPIFYPLSSVPEAYRPLIMLNPLTFIIEEARAVLIWGRMPDWSGLLVYSVIAGVVACLGFAWFQKTRKGFADVV